MIVDRGNHGNRRGELDGTVGRRVRNGVVPRDVVPIERNRRRDGGGKTTTARADVVGARRQRQRIAARIPGRRGESSLAVLANRLNGDSPQPLADGVLAASVRIVVKHPGQNRVSRSPAEFLGHNRGADVGPRGRCIGRRDVGQQPDPDLAVRIVRTPWIPFAGTGSKLVGEMRKVGIAPVDQECRGEVIDVGREVRGIHVSRVGENVLSRGPTTRAGGIKGLAVGSGGDGRIVQIPARRMKLKILGEHRGAMRSGRLDQLRVEGRWSRHGERDRTARARPAAVPRPRDSLERD